MKSVLRLVKTSRPADKKPVSREQRFRYPADDVSEISCGSSPRQPRRERPAVVSERRAS